MPRQSMYPGEATATCRRSGTSRTAIMSRSMTSPSQGGVLAACHEVDDAILDCDVARHVETGLTEAAENGLQVELGC